MHCCDATGEVAIADAREAGFADHLGKSFLLWKLADGFHQILVWLVVARSNFTQPRDHLERVKIEEFVEDRHGYFGKLQAHETAAGLQDAMGN